MAKTKISEFSSTPANNTDIDSINIAEGCAPSNINDAIRELMAQLKDFQIGSQGDSFNGPIGTSTAAAGAFTTLSASSTVTLSGGTANGVTYLNGSKVLTSGSALTFDGTKWTQTASTTGILSEFKNSNTGNQNGNIVASNDAGTAVRLQVFGSAAGSYGMLSASSPVLYTSASELNFVADNASGVIKFGLNGSAEQMRLTSTGLGIGTSSPSQKLEVAGNIYINTSGNPYLQIKTSGAGNNPYILLQADTASWNIQGTFSNAGDELYLIYSGSNRGYFNSSTGVYVPVSDRNLKKDITDISYGLSAVMALRPVEYLMKTETEGSQKHLGFIAQEAQTAVPSSVSQMTDGMFGMDKTELIAVLVKGMQEQQAIIESLKARLDAANL